MHLWRKALAETHLLVWVGTLYRGAWMMSRAVLALGRCCINKGTGKALIARFEIEYVDHFLRLVISLSNSLYLSLG